MKYSNIDWINEQKPCHIRIQSSNSSSVKEKMADRQNSLKRIYETRKALSGAFREEIIELIRVSVQMIYQGFKGYSARGQQNCQSLQLSKIDLVLL